MNNFFYLLLFILFNNVFAQHDFKFEAGYNWTKFIGCSENPQNGDSFGATWRYHYQPHLFFGGGVRVEHINIQIANVTPRDIRNEINLEPEFIYSSTRSEKSKFLNFFFNFGYLYNINKNVSVSFKGGAYFSYALSQKTETSDSYLLYTYIPDQNGPYDPPYGKLQHWYDSVNDETLKHHKAGLEFSTEANYKDFALELRYNITRTTVIGTIRGFNEFMNTFSISIGYYISTLFKDNE